MSHRRSVPEEPPTVNLVRSGRTVPVQPRDVIADTRSVSVRRLTAVLAALVLAFLTASGSSAARRVVPAQTPATEIHVCRERLPLHALGGVAQPGRHRDLRLRGSFPSHGDGCERDGAVRLRFGRRRRGELRGDGARGGRVPIHLHPAPLDGRTHRRADARATAAGHTHRCLHGDVGSRRARRRVRATTSSCEGRGDTGGRGCRTKPRPASRSGCMRATACTASVRACARS